MIFVFAEEVQESDLLEVVSFSLPVGSEDEALSFLDLGPRGRKCFLDRSEINWGFLHTRVIFNFKPIVGLMFT